MGSGPLGPRMHGRWSEMAIWRGAIFRTRSRYFVQVEPMTASEPCGAESMIMSMIIGKAVWSIPRDNEDSVFGAAGARCGLVPGPFVSASSEGDSEVEEVPEGVGTAAFVSADDVGLSSVVGLVGVVGSVAVETAEVAVILALICPGTAELLGQHCRMARVGCWTHLLPRPCNALVGEARMME